MMQEEGDIMRTTKRPRNEANVANNSSISKTSNIEFRRSFNHIEGNWPTFVYIPVRGSNSVQRLLSICIDHFLCVHQLLEDSICREATPHISLSRTLTLRFHQIDAFVATLGRSLQSMTRFNVTVPSQYFFMSNDECTRHFLCSPILDHANSLTHLLIGVDSCVTRFQKEVYYSPPVFHVSGASMLLDPRKHTTTSIKTSNGSDSSTEYVTVPRPIEDQNHKIDSETEVEEDEGDNGDSWRQHLPSSNKTITKSEPYTALLSVDCVECRIGDRIFRLNLPISGAGLGTEIKSEFREVFA